MSDVERAARRWVVAFRAKHEVEKRWQSREIEFDSFFEALREFHEARRALFEAVDARLPDRAGE